MVGSYRETRLPLFIRRANSGGLVVTYRIPAPLLFNGHIYVWKPVRKADCFRFSLANRRDRKWRIRVFQGEIKEFKI
jgi:hypothetical protein